MKTLDQVANELNVSRAAIYKKFENYGLSVTNLRNEKQGKTKVYDEEVVRLIHFMFQPVTDTETKAIDTIVTEEVTENEKNQDIYSKISKLQEQNGKLEQELEERKTLTDRLSKMLEDMTAANREREAAETIRLKLDLLHSQETMVLPAVNEKPRGLMAWLRGKKTNK